MLDAVLQPSQEVEATNAAIRMEQTLLAALLSNPACIEALPQGFGSHHFCGLEHPEIFEAIKAAAVPGARAILPAVRTALPSLGAPGGYLTQVYSAVISSRPGDAKLYAEAVMDAADRRALAQLAADVKQLAEDTSPSRQPPVAVINQALERLDRIAAGQRRGRPAVTLDEAMADAIKSGEEAAARGSHLSGISTGFDCIDERLGGLEGGAVYVCGARPGVGKSSLGLQIGLRAARGGNPVQFISLEMQARQFGRRALALASAVDMRALKRGEFARNTAMAEAVVKGRQRLAALPFIIEDEPALTVPAISLRVKAALRRFGKLGLLVIDHLHIVGKPESASRFGDTQAITEISSGIKRLAKEFDIPVLLLAQLSRAVENREDRRPCLADLRQSGAIEQDAEAVFFIYRPEMHMPGTLVMPQRRRREDDDQYASRCADVERQAQQAQGRAELIFDKVRDGERGVDILNFDAQRVRFWEDSER